MKQLALDITSSPAPTFENFVVGRNSEAIAHLRDAVAGNSERFVYVWAESGSGRSHLLKAAVAESPGAQYVACGPQCRFDDTAPLLIADDVDCLDSDGQVALFNRYNALREQGGGLISSGSVPPVQLALRADLLTRLGWGLVIKLHPLTDDEKTQALLRHAQARGFYMAPEVCSYLLAHTPRDMGALFAMLDGLDRFSLETKRAVTVPLVRSYLSAVK